MKRIAILWIFVSCFLGGIVQAETLTPEQEKALQGALQELTNPTQRAENLKKDKKAAESDEFVKSLGGEYSEEIYQLAAKVMESLVVQTQGDTKAMESLLEKARKDPAIFANTFSADQKKLLKDLAKKIEGSKKKPLP